MITGAGGRVGRSLQNALMLSVSDEHGGYKAALRVAIGLRRRGLDLQMAVQRKTGDRYWIVKGQSKKQKLLASIMQYIDRLPNMFYAKRSVEPWSNNWFPNDIASAFGFDRYDLLHMHWIGGGFFPMRNMARTQLPIVWTLHDMWAFTGGCHYSGDCTRYEQRCGTCPQLGSSQGSDLSAFNHSAKRSAYAGKNLHVVCPSNWLAGLARKSSLFANVDVSVIPNGIDLSVYRPINRHTARELLGIPADARIILFGATNAIGDERKGFKLVCSAITDMPSLHDGNTELIVFGSSEPLQPTNIGIPVRFFGKLFDDSTLACLYSAADIMVAPSRQENLASTIMEAMACGTPVVAFDLGGNGDLVDHLQNGYLAEPLNPDDLARGIAWAFEDKDRLESVSIAARAKCERVFDLNVVCAQYENLYNRMCMTQ